MFRSYGLLLAGMVSTAGAFVGCLRQPADVNKPKPVAAPSGIAVDLIGASVGRPNVIVVSMDALRYDSTGLSTPPAPWTPHLDSFSKQAVVFHQVVSAAPWTVPSHMSMWTGRWPTRHGMVNKFRDDPVNRTRVETSLAMDIETYPERLVWAGWNAVAFTGGAGVSGRFGFGRGFSTYVDDRRFAGLEYSVPAALRWLETKPDGPFLMFLHGYDVHGQHTLGKPAREVLPDYHGHLDGSIVENERLRETGLGVIRAPGQPASLKGVISKEDGRFLRAVYDNKVKEADGRLGEFLAAIGRLGLLENTIIAIVSDHGDEFMEHDHFDHGHTLYEEQLHVVTAIRFPGRLVRQDVRTVTRTVDLFPTLFDALGLPPLPGVDGSSLLPVIRGKETNDRIAYAESDYRLFVHHRMVRAGPLKLIFDMGDNELKLFNLASDPTEQTNVSNVRSLGPRLHDLDMKLEQWFGYVKTPRNAHMGVKEAPIVVF